MPRCAQGLLELAHPREYGTPVRIETAKGVGMRVLLAASAIALCACSRSIKGQFLSSEQYVNVYEENGQLLAGH